MQAVREQPGHGSGFHRIIGWRGRAMQIQIADVGGADAGTRQCITHGQLRAQALRVRGGHVVGIAGFAITTQLQCCFITGIAAFQYRESTCLTQ